MAGMYVEFQPRQYKPRLHQPLRYVDIGDCEIVQRFCSPQVRAMWTFWRGTAQWRVMRWPHRLIVIEGVPDRYPERDESIASWLKDRWGSYRGFEACIGAEGTTRVTAFVDPWASRPLFLDCSRSDSFAIADKLATLVVNSPEPPMLNWGAALEAMIVSHYSYDTTVEGVLQLKPGEAIVLTDHGNTWLRESMPIDSELTEQVRRDPEGALLQSLRRAVAEIWTDSDTWLLLSGGLDSRITLAAARGGRKALTIGQADHIEVRVAHTVARACGAEWRLEPFPVEQHLFAASTGYLLTGAMADAKFAYNFGTEWRTRGIRSVTHAYLFDTVLKGYYMYPWVDAPRPVFELIGKHSQCARLWSSRDSQTAANDVFAILSDYGRQLAMARLASMTESIEPSASGGFDLTLENRTLRWVSKLNDYPFALALMESVDVCAPIWHPALWTWSTASAPCDRHHGRALRRAFLRLRHPVAAIVDANTGITISEDDAFEPTPGALYGDKTALWPRLSAALRTRRGYDLMQEGLSALIGTALIDRNRLSAAVERFLEWDDSLEEVIFILASVGNWSRAVREHSNFSHPAIQDLGRKPVQEVVLPVSQ